MAEESFRLKEGAPVVVVYPAHTIEKDEASAALLARLCTSLSKIAQIEKIGRDDFSDARSTGAALIICLGGDGTTLDVARHTQTSPVLSLKLRPDSVGYLCTDDASQPDKIAHKLTQNGAFVVSRSRLQLVVNGKPVGVPVTNDILIANESPARTTRYLLNYAQFQERHCSSGLWIATARGSHAAARSAGAHPLPDDDARFVLRVRELNHANTTTPTLDAVFSPDQPPELVMLSNHIAAFADGDLWRYPLEPSDCVSFCDAEPMRVVKFR